jgi:hypothetical protein
MPTKYELMTELRVLSRGLKPLAISRMNKGELLASIELTKKMIQDKGLIPEINGKRDRYLPRPIESEETKIDDVVLNVPLKPRAIVKCKKDIETAKLVPAYTATLIENKGTVSFDD